MKRSWIRRTAAVMLLLFLMCNAALAQVTTTGEVNLRTGPGLGYKIVASVKKGTKLTYLGDESVDNRGVTWYKVSYKDRGCWISSVYSELNPKSASYYSDDWPDIYQYGIAKFELADLWNTNLKAAAKKANASYHTYNSYSEVPEVYYNNWVVLAGTNKVDFIELYGGDYCLHGVTVDMDPEIAAGILVAQGFSYSWDYEDCMIFEEYSNGEYGSCINIFLEDGWISYISWNSYTG